MAIIHRIGAPENDSEAKAIKRLGKDLPADYFVFHNFELTTGRGLPYEYDIAVLTPHALYHLEVKGYHGEIRGNPLQWIFENGGVYPSPIPLANKKTKILAGKLRQYSHRLDDVFVDTLILLTEDRARAMISDDQAGRVIHLKDAVDRLSNPKYLPVSTGDVSPLQNMVCEALFNTRPAQRVQRIGLYDIVEKLDQDDRFTVFLAKHRFIHTQPLTVLKVYHLDIYATAEEKQYRIREIFHSQDAMRLLGMHPNLVRIGDMFTWNDDSFVEPVGYIEGGQLLEWLLDKRSQQALTWDDKARIIKGIAAGLAHAHKHGVIHRDVRPRNIVIAPGGVVKLGNFDLAFIPNAPNLSIANTIRDHFDPRYVAPAVWENPRDVAPASDVYSLGLVFYQLITREPPRYDVEAVLAGQGPAIDAELLAAELGRKSSPNFMSNPAGAAEVIGRMCAPQRSDRYATLAEALEDLAICET
jgi:protein kinase-like protein/nuclease-like protein